MCAASPTALQHLSVPQGHFDCFFLPSALWHERVSREGASKRKNPLAGNRAASSALTMAAAKPRCWRAAAAQRGPMSPSSTAGRPHGRVQRLGGALCGERWGFAPRAVRGLLTELPGPSRPHSPSGPPRAPSAPPQEPLRTPSIPSRAPRAPSGAPRHPLHPFRSPSRAPQHSQHPSAPSVPPQHLPYPLSTPGTAPRTPQYPPFPLRRPHEGPRLGPGRDFQASPPRPGLTPSPTTSEPARALSRPSFYRDSA